MGDILVFLTGQDDIDTMVQLLSEESANLNRKAPGLIYLYISFLFRNGWAVTGCMFGI